jgi:hypothetical protein
MPNLRTETVATLQDFIRLIDSLITDPQDPYWFRGVAVDSRVRGNFHARVLALKFHTHDSAATAAVVAQVSKPAVSPTSKSAECRDCIGTRRFGNLRYSRFGNLRYRQRCEISGLGGWGRVNRPHR